MQNKQAFGLRNMLIVYNGFSGALSLWMMYEFFVSSFLNPDFNLLCQDMDEDDRSPMTMRLINVHWWCFLFGEYAQLLHSHIDVCLLWLGCYWSPHAKVPLVEKVPYKNANGTICVHLPLLCQCCHAHYSTDGENDAVGSLDIYDFALLPLQSILSNILHSEEEA